jgi:penicillin-binding protein 1C
LQFPAAFLAKYGAKFGARLRSFAGSDAWPRRLVAGLVGLVAAMLLLDALFPPPLTRAHVNSVLVTDRHGKPLRAFAAPDGRWRFAVRLEDVDPAFLDALVRVEDKRFWRHHGTDWSGMARAVIDSAAAGRIVSGGSTITMQTARMLEPRPRNIGSKLVELWRANQLERRFSKEEILELYLTLTPYGGNLEGVRAASWSYFGHEADHLSSDEIALLIALPQSPEVRRPDRRPAQAKKARDWVAAKLEHLRRICARRGRGGGGAAGAGAAAGFPGPGLARRGRGAGERAARGRALDAWTPACRRSLSGSR